MPGNHQHSVCSLESVFDKDETKVCYVSEQGQPVARQVKTGERNEHFIVVKEGIKEGDEVYLYDPFSGK